MSEITAKSLDDEAKYAQYAAEEAKITVEQVAEEARYAYGAARRYAMWASAYAKSCKAAVEKEIHGG